MRLSKEMRLANEVVAHLLAENPLARDSHLTLLIAYWQSEGVELTTAQVSKMYELLAPETIRRTAQRIQNGLKVYEPSKRVKRNRMKKEAEMRTEMKKPIRYEWNNETNTGTPIYG